MKNVPIMTVDQVRTYLQTTSTEYNLDMVNFLDIVDSDVKEITNSQWRIDLTADTLTSTGALDNVGFENEYDLYDNLSIGSVIISTTGTSLSTDVTITDWTSEDDEIVASSTPSSTGTTIKFSASSFPKGKKAIAAKMVLYHIVSSSTGEALNDIIQSKSLGPASVTYAEGNYVLADGYPSKLIEGLRSIMQVDLV